MHENLARHLSLALRTILQHPAYSTTVAATLAAGVALCGTAAIFVDALTASPLPYPTADRVSVLWLSNPARNLTRMVLSFEELREYRERATTQQTVAGYIPWTAVVNHGGTAERAQVNLVSAQYFDVLGVAPQVGRVFTPQEDRASTGNALTVISHGFWTRVLGGQRDVLGRAISLDNRPYTIIGVMPPDFTDVTSPRTETELWIPLSSAPAFLPANVLTERRMRVIGTLALRQPDASPESARSEAASIARGWANERPDTNEGLSLAPTPLAEALLGSFRPQVVVLGVAAVSVLLIGCVNIVNLMLMRGTARSHEMAVRSSMGASRSRLFRQLTMENLVLSMLGAGAGAMLVPATAAALLRVSPVDLPAFVSLGGHYLLLAGVAAAGALTGTLCGVLPSLHLTRTASTQSLRSEGRGTTAGKARRRWQRALVTAEVALSMALLAGAASAVQSFQRLQAIDPGYQPESLLTLRANLGGDAYASPEDRIAFASRALDVLREQPGVSTADVWAPNMPGSATLLSSVVPEGRPRDTQDRWTVVRRHHVSPNALEHLGMTLVAGRGITDADHERSRLVAVVSESLARTLWPGEDPIGKMLFGQQAGIVAEQSPRFEVVGVVKDAKHLGRTRPTGTDGGRDVYYAFRQMSRRELSFVIRTEVEPLTLAEAIRQKLSSVDPGIVAYDVASMASRMAQDEARPRFNAVVILLLGALALGLAGIGTYGVLGYAVLERTSEIGVRMALGARRASVLMATLRSGLALVGAGLAAGTAVALTIAPIAGSWNRAIGPADVWSLGAAAALVACIGALACLIPAHRASRVDPLVAMRHR